MADSLKGTMFQCVAKLDSTFHFDNVVDNIDYWEKQSVAKLKAEVIAAPRGKLGDGEKLTDILGYIDMDNIGSMQLKMSVKERMCSVIVFNNGAVKISGAIGSVCDDKGLLEFMNEVCNEICKWTGSMLFEDPKIRCLNGQFCVPKMTTAQLCRMVNELSPRFANVKMPEYDVPGRRGAYKMYYYADRKFHVAIDTGGKCQIFAAKSFEELREIRRQFYV